VQGFDVDLMNALAQAGNFKVDYKHQPCPCPGQQRCRYAYFRGNHHR
jgi:ABC-type amino acid transport substrate-binding protein